MYHHVQVIFKIITIICHCWWGEGRQNERVGESYVRHLEGVVSGGQLGWLSSTVGSGE